jgi:putative FmdB family regulatory protein
MPFYEYVCEACGKDFVLLQSMGAREEETACPYCHEMKSKKMLSKFSAGGHDHSVCGIGAGGRGGG